MDAQRKHRHVVRGLMVAVALSVGVGFFVGRARAGGVPGANPLRFAGTITEQGVPVNGQRVIDVIVWDDPTAGNVLCTTSSGLVNIVQGRFSVPLVDDCTKAIQGDLAAQPSALPNHPDTWVEIKVNAASFGRQKIDAAPYALMAGAVNGAVTSTVIAPISAADGTLGRGAGGASIYNDGTQQAMVVTGNKGSGAGKVVLKDNVTVGNSVSVGAGGVSTSGDVTATGRFGLGHYFRDLTNQSSAEVYCNPGDIVVGGGAICKVSPDDQLLYASYPVWDGGQNYGWHAVCANHNNSGLQENPTLIRAICLSHGK